MIEYIAKRSIFMKDKIKKFINEYKLIKKEYNESIEMENTYRDKIKKRIPNILTKSRILSPLVIAPIAILGNFTTVTIVSVIFGLTDAFDGKLARKWNATSEYGKLLDTIADKVFALTLSLPLLIANPLMIAPIVLLETAIGGVAIKSKLKNNTPHSTMLGKVKTCFLYTSLSVLYLFKCLNLNIDKLIYLLGATNLLQAATAIQYYQMDKKESKKKQIENQINIINEEENQKTNNIKNSKERQIENSIKYSKQEENKPELNKNDIQQELDEYIKLKESLLQNRSNDSNSIEKEKGFVKRFKKNDR